MTQRLLAQYGEDLSEKFVTVTEDQIRFGA